MCNAVLFFHTKVRGCDYQNNGGEGKGELKDKGTVKNGGNKFLDIL